MRSFGSSVLMILMETGWHWSNTRPYWIFFFFFGQEMVWIFCCLCWISVPKTTQSQNWTAGSLLGLLVKSLLLFFFFSNFLLLLFSFLTKEALWKFSSILCFFFLFIAVLDRTLSADVRDSTFQSRRNSAPSCYLDLQHRGQWASGFLAGGLSSAANARIVHSRFRVVADAVEEKCLDVFGMWYRRREDLFKTKRTSLFRIRSSCWDVTSMGGQVSLTFVWKKWTWMDVKWTRK